MLSVQISAAKNLRVPLERVSAAINKNTPIEQCVLFEASEEGLTLTAVDSRTHQLTLRVPDVSVFHVGSCIVDGSFVNRMVKTLDDDSPIDMAVDEDANQLLIQCGTRIEIPLYADPVSEFPLQKEMPPVVTTVDAERLTEAIKKALWLSEKNEFITLMGEEDFLKVYTRFDNRLFSRTLLKAAEQDEEWAVSIPMHLFARLPNNMVGDAEIRLDPNYDQLVISLGQEHLVIRQLATDTVSNLIDGVADANTERYWVMKSDPFVSDIRRASIIKSKRGMRLERQRNSLLATYGATARAMVNTQHALMESSQDLEPMHLDPLLLEKATRALEAVDLLAEQVEEVTPSPIPGMEPMRFFNLRLTDQDSPDYRTVIMTTLQID